MKTNKRPDIKRRKKRKRSFDVSFETGKMLNKKRQWAKKNLRLSAQVFQNNKPLLFGAAQFASSDNNAKGRNATGKRQCEGRRFRGGCTVHGCDRQRECTLVIRCAV